jgi:hypothetical protein
MIKGALKFPRHASRPSLPFRFNVVAAATAMTREEFVNEQTTEAMKLRDGDSCRRQSRTGSAGPGRQSGCLGYVLSSALEAGGLLRPVAACRRCARTPRP